MIQKLNNHCNPCFPKIYNYCLTSGWSRVGTQFTKRAIAYLPPRGHRTVKTPIGPLEVVGRLDISGPPVLPSRRQRKYRCITSSTSSHSWSPCRVSKLSVSSAMLLAGCHFSLCRFSVTVFLWFEPNSLYRMMSMLSSPSAHVESSPRNSSLDTISKHFTFLASSYFLR